ncbi:MAG: sensor histidine kinase [Bdellovibrionales bacterium]
MAGAKTQNPSWKIIVAAIWLLFSLSLATWWVWFVTGELQQLQLLQTNLSEELARKHRMLMWEGGSLILLLAVGGASLIYFIYRENKRYREVKEFFAAFTHDLKTSLASLRLQAESLQEDVKEFQDSSQKRLLERLLKDSVRLELQLENSLFLANVESNQLFLEEISLSRLVEGLRLQWPEIQIVLEGDARVMADQRALESVFKNMIQNAIIHGQAKNLRIRAKQNSNNNVSVVFEDDGKGFQGDIKKLGQMFVRHNSRSGSGVGLYLARELTQKMKGSIDFASTSQKGFGATVHLRSRSV